MLFCSRLHKGTTSLPPLSSNFHHHLPVSSVRAHIDLLRSSYCHSRVIRLHLTFKHASRPVLRHFWCLERHFPQLVCPFFCLLHLALRPLILSYSSLQLGYRLFRTNSRVISLPASLPIATEVCPSSFPPGPHSLYRPQSENGNSCGEKRKSPSPSPQLCPGRPSSSSSTSSSEKEVSSLCGAWLERLIVKFTSVEGCL